MHNKKENNTPHNRKMPTTTPHLEYALPPEWHEQGCVQLTWPHADTDWKPYLEDITRTFADIAEAITRHERLLVAARCPHDVMQVLAARLSEESLARVTVCACDNDDTWARDHAFITTVSQNGNGAPAHMLDFCFNGWGKKFAADRDNRINRTLHAAGLFAGERVDCGDFVLEGGSIESDGNGTVLTTSQCLLAPNRNQPLTQDDIERRLKLSLGARKVVWLDHGTLEGDDTDGHIDTIVRTAPGGTLLYVGSGSPDDTQHDDFAALEEQLRGVTDADGNSYRLLPLPMPQPIYDGDDRLPATYANFLVINGAVIVPTYAQPDNDAEAMRTVAEAFPGREIIGIDARTIIRQHGSIHCLTMQYPKEAFTPQTK